MTTAIAELRRMAAKFTRRAGKAEQWRSWGEYAALLDAARMCRARAAELARPKKKAR